MSEYCVAFFLVLGSLFIFIGSLGVVRLPDIFCRAHSLSKALTLGISLMLIALAFAVGFSHVGIKVFFAILFLAITIPLAGHLFALLGFRIFGKRP